MLSFQENILKKRNIDMVGQYRHFMYEGEGWMVSDLLDTKNTPFAEDIELARQMLGAIEGIESMRRSGVELDVRTPAPAMRFIERTLSEWFEIVAQIEKERGHLPYLIDRSLYPGGDVRWNQGLTRNDLMGWLGDSPFSPDVGDKMAWALSRMPKVAGKDEPLSGYYNRLLPIKFVLRMLAILNFNDDEWDTEEGFSDESEGPELDFKDFRDKVCKTAVYAGLTLEKYDKTNKFERGEGVSVGFPTESVKSQERFVSQFVGSKRKGKLSGALFEMGFANIPAFKIPGLPELSTNQIKFTKEGFYFAMLGNPVIDEDDGWEEGSRFSKEECEFLLEHFKRNVPAEWEFMLQMAGMIRSGIDRPNPIVSELMSTRGWDNAKSSIMRTGVTARMQELGLIERERSGVDIRFIVTKLGGDLLVSEEV